jgi:hypothetical protein
VPAHKHRQLLTFLRMSCSICWRSPVTIRQRLAHYATCAEVGRLCRSDLVLSACSPTNVLFIHPQSLNVYQCTRVSRMATSLPGYGIRSDDGPLRGFSDPLGDSWSAAVRQGELVTSGAQTGPSEIAGGERTIVSVTPMLNRSTRLDHQSGLQITW